MEKFSEMNVVYICSSQASDRVVFNTKVTEVEHHTQSRVLLFILCLNKKLLSLLLLKLVIW